MRCCSELHVYILALQRYLFDSPELAMRVTQVGIAVIGLVLLAAAVYELAGPRASVLAMWLLALEPASIFFSSLLHKEANMLLAIGLVALGGAKVWKRGEPRHMAMVIAGCLIAVATRQYAGWFLIAAGAAILLHAGLRAEHRTAIRSLALVASVDPLRRDRRADRAQRLDRREPRTKRPAPPGTRTRRTTRT